MRAVAGVSVGSVPHQLPVARLAVAAVVDGEVEDEFLTGFWGEAESLEGDGSLDRIAHPVGAGHHGQIAAILSRRPGEVPLRPAIDSTRVYLIGTSGGGYTSLLMAGRHPELWAGVSAWVPITDLTAWYHENKAMGDKHWREVADSCSGSPRTSKEGDEQYKLRSPLTYLEDAREVAIDINAGIRDGHEGGVPVSHSLRAFNTIAHQHDRFTNQDIQSIVETATIPKHLQHEISDPTYGDKQPLLRRYAGRARVTLFDGRHEYIPEAALRWLEKQQLVIPPPSASKLSGLPAKGPYFPVDERIIEDRWELSRKVVPLQRHPSNPLFKGEHPWEGTGPAPQTVFRDPDDGLLKMWYGVWNKYNYENGLPFSYNICYAESSDGLKWNKPVLNLFDHHNSG